MLDVLCVCCLTLYTWPGSTLRRVLHGNPQNTPLHVCAGEDHLLRPTEVLLVLNLSQELDE